MTKPILLNTDLEPDDFAVLLWLIRLKVTNLSILVTKGDLNNKMLWLQAFLSPYWEIAKEWKIYKGVSSDAEYPKFPKELDQKYETLVVSGYDKFEELIEKHGDILSCGPVTQFLQAANSGITFPGHRFFGTMSFNFRDAAVDLTKDAEKMIGLFPDGFMWIESFQAIGSENSASIEFTDPVLRKIQVDWNKHLLGKHLKSIKFFLDYDPSIAPYGELQKEFAKAQRRVKAVQSIQEKGTSNCLLVDPLLVAIYFFPERFPLHQVKYMQHNAAGYPMFESAKEGHLFVADKPRGLRDFVLTTMQTF